MKKTTIKVPDGIRYLGQWQDFGKQLPNSHFILNKALTGVGATEYFLSNDEKTIVCSPRVALLNSKKTKHSEVWFYRDMADTTASDDNLKKSRSKKKANYKDIQKFNQDVAKYIDTCKQKGQIPKIMVTYDSLGHVLDALKMINPNESDNWTVVIDEFQVIFSDSMFKSVTEMSFLNNVSNFKKVIYLSATPYLEIYLKMLEPFCNLEFIELDWPEKMKVKAKVINIPLGSKSRNQQCKEIIKKMEKGESVKFGSMEIDTTEAVFYLNNVRDIINICTSLKLDPEEVNILCSNTNEDKLKKAGYSMGTFPKEGEPCKPFTFCTRSSFLGVDFYSTCAFSYVFADPSQKTLALDVSTDLPQILGRQRLDSNRYKNVAILFYKQNSIGANQTDYFKYINKKKDVTQKLIDDFHSKTDPELKEQLLKGYRDLVEKNHFSDNYLCVITDPKTGKADVAFNELFEQAEFRTWQIQKYNFSNSYTVVNQQQQQGINGSEGTKSTNPDVIAFENQFNGAHITDQRIRLYCDFRKQHPELVDELDFVSPKYASYWDALGYDNLSKLGFQESRIKQALQVPTPFDDKMEKLVLEVRAALQEGKKYQTKDLKKKLNEAYKKAGYNGTATATDAEKFVTIRKFQDSKTGKRSIIVTSPFQKNITMFPFVWRPNVPMKITVDRFLDIIKTGKYTVKKNKTETRELKDIITEIRSYSDHDKQSVLKKDWLPIACINGTFKHRDNSGIESYSSFTALDYDGFGSKKEMAEAKKKLETFDFVYAIFETPSGHGLKAVILHDSVNPELHWNLFKQLMKKCSLPQLDTSVSDLSRAQYFSYDPNLWLNPNPKAFHFEVDPSIQPDVEKEEVTVVDSNKNEIKLDSETSDFLLKLGKELRTDETILRCLDTHWKKSPELYKEGNRHKSILMMAGTLCKAGVEMKTTLEYIIDNYKDKPEDEIERAVDYAYDNNPYGSNRRLFR